MRMKKNKWGSYIKHLRNLFNGILLLVKATSKGI